MPRISKFRGRGGRHDIHPGSEEGEQQNDSCGFNVGHLIFQQDFMCCTNALPERREGPVVFPCTRYNLPLRPTPDSHPRRNRESAGGYYRQVSALRSTLFRRERRHFSWSANVGNRWQSKVNIKHRKVPKYQRRRTENRESAADYVRHGYVHMCTQH